MTTVDHPWHQVPDDWTTLTDETLRWAIARAGEALDVVGADPVGSRLADYYDRAGNFAGATFAELLPVDPTDITATDLQAVSLLSVSVGPGATRRFLEPGPVRSALLDKLRAVRDVELHVAGSDDFAAMAAFYEEVKSTSASRPLPQVTGG